MKRTIALDCRMIGRSGVGRYVESILDEITSQDIEDFQFLLVGPCERLSQYSNRKNIAGIESYEIEPLSLRDTLEGTRFFIRLSKKVDLIHFTHFNLPLFAPRNSVVTIHDLTPLILKELFPVGKRFSLSLLLRLNKRRIRRFIAVSQSTKNDLAQLLGIPSEKVEVIYERVSSRLVHCDRILPEELRGREYFLYVGNKKRHQNLDTAIRAFDVFFDDHPDWKFVIAGKKDKQRDYVDETLENVRNRSCFIEYDGPSDETLAGLYSNTRGVVLLSLYEGFGLPVIEGFAFGKPAIVSNRSSLPEIAGEAGIVVDLSNEGEIIDSFEAIAVDNDRYKKLSIASIENARYYRSYDTLEKMRMVYIKCL
ncbi:glycosyltransferase family 4 protein [Mesotoga sp.]|uniref:glycosyltransferase family 4 protein n=1 Tax=Mesotoga sp. TaxID=2053577 RepID=UPI00345ED712